MQVHHVCTVRLWKWIITVIWVWRVFETTKCRSGFTLRDVLQLCGISCKLEYLVTCNIKSCRTDECGIACCMNCQWEQVRTGITRLVLHSMSDLLFTCLEIRKVQQVTHTLSYTMASLNSEALKHSAKLSILWTSADQRLFAFCFHQHTRAQVHLAVVTAIVKQKIRTGIFSAQASRWTWI